MSQKVKFALMALLISGGAWFAPAAKADEWNKETVMTFNEPVEIPGKVLAAGTYVFKLADSESNRTVVQVFTEAQKQLVATVLGLPDYRQEPTGKTVVTFEERPSGSPEAVHTWFYPGDNFGVEFVYPKSVAVAKLAAPAPTPVAPSPAAPAPAISEQPPAEPKTVSAPPVTDDGFAVVEEEAQVIVASADNAQSDSQDTGSSLPAELPHTAGNFALIPLLGTALLLGGSGAVALAKQQK